VPEEDRKSGFLRVRLSAAHQEEIKEAAKQAGISVSAWATERLLKAARQEKAKG
jgi:predicted HicB family RNase H-like nuclease